MPAGLLMSLERLFGTKNLYAVLGLDPDKANEIKDAQVKKAYHKTSLKVHPDRAPEDDRKDATEKFQCLGAVYKVLSDPDKRALYDESGEVEEDDHSLLVNEEQDWDQYWRLLFKKLTVDDIKKFEQTYKGSEEEKADLKQAYVDGEGSMDYILDNVLCCTMDDEERFSSLIRGWIDDGEVPGFKKFTKETAKKKNERKRRLEEEKMEAEAEARELGLGDGEDSLKQAIMKRQEQRAAQADSFLDQLAAKYGNKKSGRKTKGKAK